MWSTTKAFAVGEALGLGQGDDRLRQMKRDDAIKEAKKRVARATGWKRGYAETKMTQENLANCFFRSRGLARQR